MLLRPIDIRRRYDNWFYDGTSHRNLEDAWYLVTKEEEYEDREGYFHMAAYVVKQRDLSRDEIYKFRYNELNEKISECRSLIKDNNLQIANLRIDIEKASALEAEYLQEIKDLREAYKFGKNENDETKQ